MLNTCHQHSRVRTPAEHGAIISECNTNSVVVIDETYGLVERQRPKGRGADAPLWEAHTSGAFGTHVTVVISHIPVEEILVIPTDDARVCPHPSEATLNVLGGYALVDVLGA